jgi:hypothetical protein
MSDNTFLDEQQKYVEGFKNNASKFAGEFKVKRFWLDNISTKDDIGGANIFLTGFKSFWVCATNNSSFVANIVVNPRGDSGQALPLKSNMSMAFSYPQSGCAIECLAQPGIWIDIAFAFNSDISPGYIQIVNSQALAPAFFFEYLQTVTTTPQILIPVNGTRITCLVENKGSVPLYIGSLLKLNDIQYKLKTKVLYPGDVIGWENLSGAYVKTESVTATDSLYLLDEYN